jgi:hypothetical protein
MARRGTNVGEGRVGFSAIHQLRRSDNRNGGCFRVGNLGLNKVAQD